MAAHKRAPAPDTFFFCDLLPLAPPFKSAMSPKINNGNSTPPPVQGAGRRRERDRPRAGPVEQQGPRGRVDARGGGEGGELAARRFWLLRFLCGERAGVWWSRRGEPARKPNHDFLNTTLFTTNALWAVEFL